jgi:hypothetical protein
MTEVGEAKSWHARGQSRPPSTSEFPEGDPGDRVAFVFLWTQNLVTAPSANTFALWVTDPPLTAW